MKQSFNTQSTQQGLASVEMAVALPFFVLMLFVITETGYAFHQMNSLNILQRSAARYLSVELPPGPDQLVDLTTPEALEAIDTAKQLVLRGTNDMTDTSDVSLEGLTVNDVNVQASAGNHIVITTTFSYIPLLGRTVLSGFYNSNRTTSFAFTLPASMAIRVVQ